MDKPIIVPSSYQLQNGGYVPSVILRFIERSNLTERPLSWNKEFSTKKEADNYALKQAELYIRKIGEIKETITELQPEEIKEKAKKFDFYIKNFKGSKSDMVGEIKVDKDNFYKKIEEEIKEEQIKKIEENLYNYLIYLDQYKLIKFPSDKIRFYITDSVSGTVAVTPFLHNNFLDRGGIIYPDYDEFLKATQEIPIAREKETQFLNIRGDNNVINQFIIKEKKSTPKEKNFSMNNPWIWLVFTLISVALTVYIIKFLK